jgi:hypothetical protein
MVVDSEESSEQPRLGKTLQPIKRSNLPAVIPRRLPWNEFPWLWRLTVKVICAHARLRRRLNELYETTVRKTARVRAICDWKS